MNSLIGRKFGLLTVMEEAQPHITPSGSRQICWKCLCDCGNPEYVIATQNHLITGHTKSCGCLKHIQYSLKHGQAGTRIYDIYYKMRRRCNNQNDPDYPRYGGRGIKICDEWLGANGFENFYKWSINNGYDESLSIDRKNNDENYCPENCRWTNHFVQSNNTSTNKYITFNGETHTYAEWGKILNVDGDTIQARIKYYGMTQEEALTKAPTCEMAIDMYDKNNNLIKSFNSVKEGAEYVGGCSSGISTCLHGRIKTYYGYIWKFGEKKYIDHNEYKYDDNIIKNHVDQEAIA